ncbi:acyltransferase family protein [Desertibaculum subflavum]|uniref:acyltransferase family protein n=1 Tax=Desertibaculum subflavum TaxID=2268458 RepID=UPI000E6715CA
MKRIAALESLRGLMALWVLVGHIVKGAGYTAADLGTFKALAEPGHAVDVFIILSGFVIFYLLDGQRPSYGEFIRRRLFRLAPVYLFVVLVSALAMSWQVGPAAWLAEQNAGYAPMLQNIRDTLEHFWLHLVLHVPMLHGLADPRLLPNSDYAFVGQGWSISVEWQFYLVAPLLFWMAVARRWYALIAALGTICLLRFTNYGGEGFAIRQGGYFLAGILTFYGYRHLQYVDIAPRLIDATAVLAITAIYLMVARSLGLIVWAAMVALILADRRPAQTAVQRIGLAIMYNSALLWLGKVSYSVYLTHGLISFLALYWLYEPFAVRGKLALALATGLATIVATLTLSAVTYRCIEAPAMDFGRRGFFRSGTAAARKAAARGMSPIQFPVKRDST